MLHLFSETGRGSSKGAGRAAEAGKRKSFSERGSRTPRTEKGMPTFIQQGRMHRIDQKSQ